MMKYIILITILILVDQIIKLNIKTDLDKKVYFLKLHYVRNKGAAMGFLKRKPRLLKFLTSFFILLLSIVFVYLYNKFYNISKFRYIFLALSFLIGGGISNLIDRFIRGFVVDFFSIRKIYFNIADLYIIIGAMMLILQDI